MVSSAPIKGPPSAAKALASSGSKALPARRFAIAIAASAPPIRAKTAAWCASCA
jgi:hypothetical protein